jgi:hypothetical protein
MEGAHTMNLNLTKQRKCQCGAIAGRSNTLCRKCRARLAWQRKVTPSRRAIRRLAAENARIVHQALTARQNADKDGGQ